MKLLEIAFSQYGIKEVPGSVDNPEIIKYFNALGFDGESLKDETAWCSASHNWIHKESGLPYTGKLNARSWMEIGVEILIPQLGDTVVFWRESKESWKGHVGIFINRIDDDIYVLGGNQSNKYCIKIYPAYRILGYRRIKELNLTV